MRLMGSVKYPKKKPFMGKVKTIDSDVKVLRFGNKIFSIPVYKIDK